MAEANIIYAHDCMDHTGKLKDRRQKVEGTVLICGSFHLMFIQLDRLL